MQFGLMFFGSSGAEETSDKYALVKTATSIADARNFSCVWTPERHFHEFGGLFPNPAVLSAALAVATDRIQIRAGSVVSPIHHAIRIAEEWSVVDNISNGRVAVSFGSGWNANDFVFFPERYCNRRQFMHEQIEFIQKFWRGEPAFLPTGSGKHAAVTLSPRPVQSELPIWITSSGNQSTFEYAGRIGANVLTHLIEQGITALADKIKLYREARRQAGFDSSTGIVSLMMHTYLGSDPEIVRGQVLIPFGNYIRSAISLEREAAVSGGTISGGRKLDDREADAALDKELVQTTVERYLHEGSLIGTVDSCEAVLTKFQEVGVNEVACLIDFGMESDAVLASLELLNSLKSRFERRAFKFIPGKETFTERLDL
jgi:natural product biosynthesis luciferase-like monooxygenase protein